MKTSLKFSLAMLIMGISYQGFSQEISEGANPSFDNEENIRPIRIGAKLGLPNLIGFNLEYVLPVLNKKLAVSADFTTLSSSSIIKILGSGDEDAIDSSYRFLEGGLNYYLFKPGKGLYAGLSFSNFKIERTIADVFESSTGETADGIIDYSQSSFNIKVGAKLGGLFYFRPEVGYAFNAFPSGVPIEGTYADGSKETAIHDSYVNDFIPKGLIFNLGFGLAF